MFIVNALVDRKLKEEELQYNYMDGDISYSDCPLVFSTFKKAMEYVNKCQKSRPNVYCMVFEEKLDYPYDIPVVYNGKFDSTRIDKEGS